MLSEGGLTSLGIENDPIDSLHSIESKLLDAMDYMYP